jgi:hypothetical protein
MTHELKVWTEYYPAIESGAKPFEIRIDDRPFSVGDDLLLREWDSVQEKYTNKETRRRITYILRDAQIFGVMAGYAILGIEKRPGIQNAQEFMQEYEKKENPFYPNECRWDRVAIHKMLRAYEDQK